MYTFKMSEVFDHENNNEKIVLNEFIDSFDLLGSKWWKGRNIENDLKKEEEGKQSDIKNIFKKDKGDFL